MNSTYLLLFSSTAALLKGSTHTLERPYNYQDMSQRINVTCLTILEDVELLVYKINIFQYVENGKRVTHLDPYCSNNRHFVR